MKKIYSPAYFFILFTIVTSCGKGIIGDARIDGIVKDSTTNEPIAGATVYLLESDGDFCLFCPIITYIVDSTTTDDEGCFEFKYDDVDGVTYAVNAVKEQYIDNQEKTFIKELGNGIDVEVFIDPEAFLKVRVHNVNIYDPSDYVIVNDLYATFYGNEVDTTEVIVVYGNKVQTLTWFVTNDGTVSSAIHAEVYCSSFDTTYYEILY